MKRLLALLLALVMLLSLAACAGEAKEDEKKDRDRNDSDTVVDTDDGNTGDDEAADPGIDLEAEGEQAMSDERASMAVLVETRDVWLEGKFSFALDENPKTYEDFVDHIGCEASFYEYKADDGERCYTWVAEEDATAKFLAVFWETPQGWTLYSVGSVNVSE